LVRLDRLWSGPGSILAKLDYLSPGGSKKDRIGVRMIEEAEECGELKPGQTVVELTSGNTGIGLAIVCAVKGYPFVAVMSRGNSEERTQMMTAFGAEVVLVNQRPGAKSGHVTGEDLALVEEVAQQISVERNAFRADQFHLAGNANAHEHGGTFAGVARYLKTQNPKVKCFPVEPAGAATLAGKKVVNPDHRIQGGGYAMEHLEGIEPGLVDGMIEISDETAIETCRRLARTEGIFAGFSSGACVAAAEHLLSTEHTGATVAVILADSGMKYLSTDLWNSRP
jgi:cysteine synthase A